MKISDRNKSQGTAGRRVKAAALAWFVLLALAGTASAQVSPQQGRASDRRPAESRPPAAQYDVGLIARRLAALEAQVTELKKRNDALASEIGQMKLRDALGSKNVNNGIPGASPGPSVQERLRKLEQAMVGHTHHMPVIGVIALNALPGMQDIANKAGVGHILQQWKEIKVHATFGGGGAPGRTGTPVPPGQ